MYKIKLWIFAYLDIIVGILSLILMLAFTFSVGLKVGLIPPLILLGLSGICALGMKIFSKFSDKYFQLYSISYYPHTREVLDSKSRVRLRETIEASQNNIKKTLGIEE